MKRNVPVQTLNKSEWLKYFYAHSFNGQMCVNRIHGPQLKDHPALRKLIKAGVFKRIRRGSRYSKTTYLILNTDHE